MSEAVPQPRDARSDLFHRAIWTSISLVLYGGGILWMFHSEADPSNQTPEILQVLGIGLFVVWIAANGMLVANGNVVISTIACVFFWWLANELTHPELTPIEESMRADGDQIDIRDTIPVIGFLNLMLLWAGHLATYLLVIRPKDEAGDSAQTQAESVPGASQSPP